MVPLLGGQVFGVAHGSALVAFVVSFGISKTIFNRFAGALADRIGRRRVLLLGWALGLPIPLLLIWAASWEWIIAANLLLGVNQALTSCSGSRHAHGDAPRRSPARTRHGTGLSSPASASPGCPAS